MKTGVVAMSSARVAGRDASGAPIGPQDLVAAEPDDAEDADPDEVARAAAGALPSRQRRSASRVVDASA